MSRQKLITQLKFTTGGLLEFMVLTMLSRRSSAPGDISDHLKMLGFKTPFGSLYPLLARLRKAGLVVTGYEESEIGTGLRSYDITRKGHIRLDELKRDWKQLNATFHRL